MSWINGYFEKDFEPHIKELSDSRLVNELNAIDKVIDSDLLDESMLFDLFIAMDTFLTNEIVRRFSLEQGIKPYA